MTNMMHVDREFLGGLFTNHPDPMWVYDVDTLSFLVVNDAAVARYGYSREEFLCMTIADIRPSEDVPALLMNLAELDGGIDRAGMWRHRVKTGEIIHVEITSHEFCSDGRRVELVLARDVSDRVHAEQRMRMLNLELERRVAERTAELESAVQHLESFSYSVSHDLQVPLRAIHGFSSLLLQDTDSELSQSGRHFLVQIRSAAERMAHIVEALLRLARVTRQELNHASADVGVLVRELYDSYRSDDPDRSVELEVRCPVDVHADPTLLRIALDNVLRNAWKFTSGRVPAHIHVEVFDQGAHTIVRVTDNGAGFEMAYAARMFEPFNRLHDPEAFEGSGIGLAIVRRIMQRHGGEVRASGEVGTGAVFELLFPRRRSVAM